MNRAILLLFILALSGCDWSSDTPPITFVGQVMTVPYRILIGQPLTHGQKKEAQRIIDSTFEEIDRVYNKWNPQSEISKLNTSKAFQKIPLASELEYFLRITERLVTITNGRFDPTVESVQKVWRGYLEKGKIPNDEDYLHLITAVGWNKVHIEEGMFWKENDLVELDLGGIAKGYAIDLLTERLAFAGFPNVYVEWGGEIRTSGRHPDQRPWRIFVSYLGDPSPSTSLAIVDLENQAIASSGDYLQQWTINGTTYFHIIDPRTCCPLIVKPDSVCSATVLANTCVEADVLATAAMLFDTPHEAEEWLESLRNDFPTLRYWVVKRALE